MFDSFDSHPSKLTLPQYHSRVYCSVSVAYEVQQRGGVSGDCASPHVMDTTPLTMSEKTSAAGAISLTEMDAWSRVMRKRRAGWMKLPPYELLAILSLSSTKEEQSPLSPEELCKSLEWLLNKNFCQSIDRQVPARKRRAAWVRLKKILHQLEEAKNRANIETGIWNTEIQGVV